MIINEFLFISARTCPINEVFTECENNICRRESCESKGIQVKCNVISKVACKPGCICAPNYLRQKNGTCIPKDQCDEPYSKFFHLFTKFKSSIGCTNSLLTISYSPY